MSYAFNRSERLCELVMKKSDLEKEYKRLAFIPAEDSAIKMNKIKQEILKLEQEIDDHVNRRN